MCSLWAVLGLCCCTGISPVVLGEPLIAGASLVAEHRVLGTSARWLQPRLQSTGSVVTVQGLAALQPLGSSWTRVQTHVSCVGGQILYPRATREALLNFHPKQCYMGFPGSSVGKESACNAGDPGLIPGSGRSTGEGNGTPTPVFLPGKSYGQRSLAGYCSPWDRESRTRLKRLNHQPKLPTFTV